MCGSYLSTLIPKFIEAFPKITVDLDSSSTFKDLQKDQMDIAIRMTRNPQPDFIARLLGEFKLAVCASPNYLAQHGTPKKPQELLQHNCVVYSTVPEGFLWEFIVSDKREEIAIKGNLSSNNSTTILNAVLQDAGICRLPSYLLHEALQLKKIKLLLEDYNTQTLPIYALYNPQPTAKVKAFIQFVKEYFTKNKL